VLASVVIAGQALRIFWVWIRGGPGAALALIGVVVAFIALFFIGSQFAAPWVTPVLVVTFFVALLYGLWLIDPRRREQPPDDADAPDRD
jgi:FtsH-binding integral membrane protein